jgi:hypothetical protein
LEVVSIKASASRGVTPFGLDEGFAECVTAAALADEVDEVGQPALLGG